MPKPRKKFSFVPDVNDLQNNLFVDQSTHIHPNFRHVDVQYYTTLPKRHIPLHQHVFYEAIFCLHGEMDYMVQGNYLHIQQGDVLIIAPQATHCPLRATDSVLHYERVVMHFNCSFLEEIDARSDGLLQGLMQVDSYAFYRPPEQFTSSFRQTLESLLTECEVYAPGANIIIDSQVACMLVRLVRLDCGHVQFPVQNENEQLLHKTLQYITQNYAENITLQSIAAHFSISESKLSRMFREHMDISCYQLIIEQRIQAAAKLLVRATPPKAVWQLCGFADYPSFYRLFKKRYNVSPKEFMLHPELF